jgi:cytochrome bd-type quinol oxidase subunit 1
MQMYVGNLTGGYIHKYQPAKFAALEARWKTQLPASEVLHAIPARSVERNLLVIEVPRLESCIESGNWNSRELGLEVRARRPSAGDDSVLRVPHHGGDGVQGSRGPMILRQHQEGTKHPVP